MTKHTPGPWEVDEYQSVGVTVQPQDHSKGLLLVMQEYPSKEESDANARLIAAAPELLEACRRAYCIFVAERSHRAAQFLADVIDKVEGKS